MGMGCECRRDSVQVEAQCNSWWRADREDGDLGLEVPIPLDSIAIYPANGSNGFVEAHRF